MEVSLSGWYVGYAVAAALIVVVVALVGWILSLARRIGMQANAILVEVSEIKVTTAPIPAIGQVNDRLTAIVNQAVTARKTLVGEQ